MRIERAVWFSQARSNCRCIERFRECPAYISSYFFCFLQSSSWALVNYLVMWHQRRKKWSAWFSCEVAMRNFISTYDNAGGHCILFIHDFREEDISCILWTAKFFVGPKSNGTFGKIKEEPYNDISHHFSISSFTGWRLLVDL